MLLLSYTCYAVQHRDAIPLNESELECRIAVNAALFSESLDFLIAKTFVSVERGLIMASAQFVLFCSCTAWYTSDFIQVYTCWNISLSHWHAHISVLKNGEGQSAVCCSNSSYKWFCFQTYMSKLSAVELFVTFLKNFMFFYQFISPHFVPHVI